MKKSSMFVAGLLLVSTQAFSNSAKELGVVDCIEYRLRGYDQPVQASAPSSDKASRFARPANNDANRSYQLYTDSNCSEKISKLNETVE